jgi:hypothetical protein
MVLGDDSELVKVANFITNFDVEKEILITTNVSAEYCNATLTKTLLPAVIIFILMALSPLSLYLLLILHF